MAVSGFMRQFRRCFAKGVDPYWVELLPGGKIMDFDSIPVVGPNVEEYKTLKIHEAYARWYKEHGYVVREVFNSGGSCIHLYHEQDISEVYRRVGEMPIRASHQVIARYRRDRPHIFTSVGLGASMGTEWRHLRNMIPPMAEPYDILRGELEEVTDDLMDVLKLNTNENGEIDLIQWLYRWAYESFGVFALRKRMDAFTPHGRQEADLMIQAADMTNETIFLTTCNVGDFEHYYKRWIPMQDFYCSTLDKHITEFEMDPNFCLLKLMMDKNRDDRQDIITVLQDLFQGAMHTAATTIGVALYHVARHGSTQQEAQKDLKKILPKKDSRFSEIEDYGLGIPSIHGIVQETQRFMCTDVRDVRTILAWDNFINSAFQNCMEYSSKTFLGATGMQRTLGMNPPTIGNGRVTMENCVLGGYFIPEGTMAVLQTQVACRLEQNFERPLEFIPERHTRLGKSMLGNLELIQPFGRGRRACPGSFFARNQMYMAVSKILRNFEISYHHEDIIFINKLHNMPDRPVMLRLKPLED